MGINQEIDGDAKGILRELDKVNRAYAKLAAENLKLTEQADKSADAGQKQAATMQSVARSAISELANMQIAYTAVSKAIDVVTEGLERQKRVQDETLGIGTTVARGQAELYRNTGEGFGTAIARLDRIQDVTNVSMGPLLAAANQALSAKPANMPLNKAFGAVEASARLMPDDPGAIAEVSKRVIEVMDATGINDPRVAAGFLQSTATQSSVVSMARVAEFASPGIFQAALMAPGSELQAARESAAIFSMFTKRGVKEAESRTATVKFQAAMEQAFAAHPGITDPLTPIARLEELQANQALQDTFLSKEFAEPSVRTQAKALLDPQGTGFEMVRANMAAIEVSAQPFEDRARGVQGGTRLLRMESARRAAEVAAERRFLSASGLGMQATVQELLERAHDSSDTNVLQRFQASVTEKGFHLRSGLGMHTPDEAPARARALVQMRRDAMAEDGITPGEAQSIASLDKILEQLRLLEETVRHGQNAALGGAATQQATRHDEN